MENSIVNDVKNLVESGIIKEVDGKNYSPVRLKRVVDEVGFKPISLNTLTGLVDYIDSNVDGINLEAALIVIHKFDSISLFSCLGDLAMDRARYISVQLSEEGDQFPFGRFIEAIKDNESAKSIVSLRPFRTFREIEQPESEFLFRMQSSGNGVPPMCALFEADGGAWRMEAIARIKTFLKEKTSSVSIIA